MLSRRVVHFATVSRLTSKGLRLYHTGDQSRQSGHAAKNGQRSSPIDAANPESRKQITREGLSGNPEGVGFADQVGYTSGSNVGKPESAEGVTGQENITPPSFTDAVKNKLGFKTTAGEDKQNRGGGKGVTGTGHSAFGTGRGARTLHTSPAWMMPAKTKGQAPHASRQPKDKIVADQNAHLKHKGDKSAADSGKGNAAKDPKLPSHQVDASSGKPKRGFHTSARVLAGQSGGGTEHTADSYFKDIDETKPVNSKVHQVDSSSDTGAPVARANEQPATGNFSRAGPESKEYETVSKHDQPYDTPPTEGSDADKKLRYGGKLGLGSPSKSDEGPSGQNAGGRKPEGRS